MWLCLYNKVLTGEKYRKRGGIGPSVCLLCLNSEETVQHLFVECPIAQELWFLICRSLKLNQNWQLRSLEDNLKQWLLGNPNSASVPFFVTWGLQLFRNSILFEGNRQSLVEVGKKVLSAIAEYVSISGNNKVKILINPVFFGNSPVGFFDGAANDGHCGVGVVLKTTSSHCYKGHIRRSVQERILKLNCWLFGDFLT